MHLQAISMLALIQPGQDWLYQFTNNLTNLTLANGGALTQIGLTFLSFTALMMLVNMVVNWGASTMTMTLQTQPVYFGDLIQFLIRLAVCCLLITYWVNPIPGASFGFNHLFSYIVQQIVTALDQNSLANLISLINDASAKTGTPSMFSPIQIVCYYIVQILLGVASGVLFVINVSSFVFYAITALFGPVFIPLYMTNSFRGKFFCFIEVLLSFAMIRAVASAFIFVWGGFMNTFITQTFAGNYSVDMWLANLIPVIMVFAAFIINMLFIPAITQAIFGGGANATASAQNLATRVALAKFRGGR